MNNDPRPGSTEGDQELPALATQDVAAETSESSEQPTARRRGRQPKSRQAEDDEQPRTLATPEQVTYTPAPGDNPEVVWMGHKFRAHIPHPVTNSRLVEMAKTNKFFHVGEFDPKLHAFKDEVPMPQTAEAYRGWAVRWFKDMRSVDEFANRWANEAKMRGKLEVGYDDYHYMSSLAQPLIDELIRKEDEPRKVRDEIIRRGDFADLELQIAGVGQVAA